MIRIHIKYALLAATLLLATGRVQAQLNIGGEPYSWSDDQLGAIPVPFEKMPVLNTAQLADEDAADEANNIPPRFGFPHPVQYTPDNSGNWNFLPNGDRIWRLGVDCPEALSVNFLFSQFWLPEGATLYIYRPDRKDVIGGFTAQNNKGSMDDPQGFGTGLVYGDKMILELYEPAGVSGQSVVNISHIVHGYRYISLPEGLGYDGFGTSGGCQVNVNCNPEGNNWQDEKKGVAMILVGGTRWCTGSLINNTCRNGDMLFLTANHCLAADGKDAISNANASNWSFWWNYETPNCANPGTEPGHKVTNGATVVANNGASDFGLLRLTESPLSQSPPVDVYMNGWDRTASPGAGGVGIHHPAGDVKKISTYTMTPFATSTCTNNSPNYWEVSWVNTANGHSVQEPGSSGSPLFHNGGLIIGQLYGPYFCADIRCNNPSQQRVVYGKISASWTGASAQRRLSDWLDPCATAVTSLSGGYPYGCPGSLLVNFPISNTRYFQSGGSITASSTMTNTSNVRMKAATVVEMTPGFDATGGFVDAYIAPCALTVVRDAKNRGEADGETLPGLATTDNSVRLFPNPASSELVVAYRVNGCDKTVFTITDMRGATLQVFNGDNSTGSEAEKQVRVNVSGFAPGTYLLHVQCSGFRETKKFVVMP